MTSMLHRLVVWTALALLTLVGSACAAYLVAPSAVIEVADQAHCQARLWLAGAPPATCDGVMNFSLARDAASPFDTASAIAVQAQGRSIGDAFGASHR